MQYNTIQYNTIQYNKKFAYKEALCKDVAEAVFKRPCPVEDKLLASKIKVEYSPWYVMKCKVISDMCSILTKGSACRNIPKP